MKKSDFDKLQGKDVILTREYRGKLLGVKDNEIVLERERKGTIKTTLPMNQIRSIKVIV